MCKRESVLVLNDVMGMNLMYLSTYTLIYERYKFDCVFNLFLKNELEDRVHTKTNRNIRQCDTSSLVRVVCVDGS